MYTATASSSDEKIAWHRSRCTRQPSLPIVGVALSALIGCATPPRIPVSATAYRIDVKLDPANHRIIGRTELDLTPIAARAAHSDEPVAVAIYLHPDLRVRQALVDGVEVERVVTVRSLLRKSKKNAEFKPRVLHIVMNEPDGPFKLVVDYDGKLFQDVSAGEEQGQIHNFKMRAHIGEDGIYLGGGHWYPSPVADEDAEPMLADYAVLADSISDVELVAGAEWDAEMANQTGRLAWSSPYPLDGMVIVGGRHEVHADAHKGCAIRLHLKSSQAEQAEGLLAAVKRNLDRYEPLIGPYPGNQFAVVDNFFSSGFAFPTFTLLSSDVINMGERSQTAHGYIDHEMLHCWWGNGIHVDPRDGNWCEALASYGANYYGYVLDGNADEARRKRRNHAHFLSRLKPKDDKPLGTFEQENGCSRGIAYSKGAAVFHMLARKIGQQSFWTVMRRFTEEYVGRYASWEDIRTLCEEESGLSLTTFFSQWIRSGGAPRLTIEDARYDSSDASLTLALSQGEPAFELEVPVRVTYTGGSRDIMVSLDVPEDEITVKLDVVPESVEVDPDYHIFRRVPRSDIIPTTATTRAGKTLTTVLPVGEIDEQYVALQRVFEKSFKEEERNSLTAGQFDADQLADRSLLVLGDAVHDTVVVSFLHEIGVDVRFVENGFEFKGVTYNDPSESVLLSVRIPGLEKGGLTVLFANSSAAIQRAFIIPFYDRSLVIFRDRTPILRHDFEPRHIVLVEQR